MMETSDSLVEAVLKEKLKSVCKVFGAVFVDHGMTG